MRIGIRGFDGIRKPALDRDLAGPLFPSATHRRRNSGTAGSLALVFVLDRSDNTLVSKRLALRFAGPVKVLVEKNGIESYSGVRYSHSRFAGEGCERKPNFGYNLLGVFPRPADIRGPSTRCTVKRNHSWARTSQHAI